jgi:hypothetical protein
MGLRQYTKRFSMLDDVSFQHALVFFSLIPLLYFNRIDEARVGIQAKAFT